MWQGHWRELAGQRALEMTIAGERGGLSFGDVIERWEDDREFRAFFTELLRAAPFQSYRWEMPPLTVASIRRSFECVLLDAPSLEVPADSTDFQEHFSGQDPVGVVTFRNLGGDAVLVAPCPGGRRGAYAHLGAFVRHAAEQQQHALWQAVAAAMRQRLGDRPVWLSTAGGGVAWLHVRLDDRPKYYGHAPYRRVRG